MTAVPAETPVITPLLSTVATDGLSDHDATLTWSAWAGAEAGSIDEAEISLERNSYTYSGSGGFCNGKVCRNPSGIRTDTHSCYSSSTCQEVFMASVPTSFWTYWSLNHDPYYYSTCKSNYQVGDILECDCCYSSSTGICIIRIIHNIIFIEC